MPIMPVFERTSNRFSLWFLNFAQFGAVVNDNIYKLVMVFLLIEAYGRESASNILSAAGAVFVIPFLLFSSASGILADRYSKKWILSIMKLFEVLIFSAAFFAVETKSVWGLYSLLFCLATHSAVFGPSKYGIIPELTTKDGVPKANGLITSCTYLGIILGTFLASFLSELTNCVYTHVIFFCLLLAILGLLNALFLPTTPRQGSRRKIHFFFLKEVFHTLRNCAPQPNLLLVLFSSAFFLFVGSFTQLNIIPYSLQGLRLSEIYGGYLFLCTAFGIAIGAFIVGRILKKEIALWVPCAAGFAIAFFLFALALFSFSLPIVLALLFFLGVAGGMFSVPLDSFVQLSCSNETRGSVIAAGNFLGFCGVLLASSLLYVMSSVLGLSAMQGFGVMSFLTLLYAIVLLFRFSSFTLPLLVKTIVRPKFMFEISDMSLLKPDSNLPLVIHEGDFHHCLLLMAILPHYHFVFMDRKKTLSMRLLNLFANVSIAFKPEEELKSQKAFCFVLPHKWDPSFLRNRYAQIDIRPSDENKGSFHVQFTIKK